MKMYQIMHVSLIKFSLNKYTRYLNRSASNCVEIYFKKGFTSLNEMLDTVYYINKIPIITR